MAEIKDWRNNQINPQLEICVADRSSTLISFQRQENFTVHEVHRSPLCFIQPQDLQKMDAVNLPSPSFTFLWSPRLHGRRQPESISPFSAKNSGKMPLRPVAKGCRTCGGKGAIECPGCKGTGKNKKNGNIFERWKCFDCQGFGLKSCPSCGKGGLTPEQRGER